MTAACYTGENPDIAVAVIFLWRYNSMKKQYESYYQPPVAPARIWSAGLYIRLSREDEQKGESNSVSSQREILREYLKQHPDIDRKSVV